MPARERMSPVDTAWLRMDRPSNLMMIVGVLHLDKPVDASRLRATLQRRLVQRFRRFRQRVVNDWSGWWWEDDPEFDLDHHFVRRALPPPAGPRELQDLVSELATEKLHPQRPLWRFDLIEDCDGGAAVVTRIHHCIADGIALVGVMLSLTDLSADAPADVLDAPTKLDEPGEDADADADANADPRGSAHPAPDWHTDPWAALLDPLAQATHAAMGLGERFWEESQVTLAQPDRLVALGRHAAGFANELARLLAMPPDSPTRLKGRTSSHKRVAWCEPIPLAEVKAVSKALGCSVNDLLLNAVAGALREYLARRGDPLEEVQLRAMVPVNLRRSDDEGRLGNRFGLVTLLLPLYEANPFARLQLLRERMLELRGSYQPPLTLMLLGATGLLPKTLQEPFLDVLASKASAVMTNVPGPTQPLYLAGQLLDQMMFWVPQSGNIGIGVSILSYNNTVQFSLIADRHFIPDPENVTPLFAAEFEKVVTGTLLHDWVTPLEAQAFESRLERELGPPSAAARRAPRRKRST
ncbi:MAG: wax ester/triacylglycerol synthase family O-acyltransferase [Leptothrix sp. (in: Bacteria)]|nr:wax ester/triacylglycerol synthase family O-acyltransferase [Leptothrix sp. (in: b-proteobacteria)]